MKAVWFEQGDINIKEVPVPKPGPGEALIRITAAGICNTDHEILKGYIPGFRGIPGHEFSGVVERSSSGRLENTRVTGEINIPCGSCSMCARGLGRHCAERTVLGIQNRNGVFAEYTTLPEENLFPLPPKISDEEGVFIEPLAAAFEVLEQIEITKGEDVLVIGDGKLGLLCGVALSGS
ncbi:MAG: alcohol dehydrogenase catalytic domain-containing protein, partial [Chitinivibrionales bacterium]